jgi:CheY-like chemotaxis protein
MSHDAFLRRAPGEVSRSRGTGAGRRLRVLVVDDEPRLREAFAKLLRSDHEVIEAGSGADALACVESGDHFDAILCDLMMPGMNGGAFYEALGRSHPEVQDRFALVTAGAFSPEDLQLLESGKVIVLDKPCRLETLLAVVEMLASREPARDSR